MTSQSHSRALLPGFQYLRLKTSLLAHLSSFKIKQEPTCIESFFELSPEVVLFNHTASPCNLLSGFSDSHLISLLLNPLPIQWVVLGRLLLAVAFTIRQVFLKHLFPQYRLLFIFFSITYPLSHPIPQWVNPQWLQDKVQILQPSIWVFPLLSNFPSHHQFIMATVNFSPSLHIMLISLSICLYCSMCLKYSFPPWHLIHAFVRSAGVIWSSALCQLLSMNAAMTNKSLYPVSKATLW